MMGPLQDVVENFSTRLDTSRNRAPTTASILPALPPLPSQKPGVAAVAKAAMASKGVVMSKASRHKISTYSEYTRPTIVEVRALSQ